MIRAVLWDFGGVILTSPFEAFNRFEQEQGLPTDFLRTVNATNPDTNAWARFERSELDAAAFDRAFAADSAALGHEVPGAAVLELLAGDVRPEMVEALRRVKAGGYRTACLTNNVAGGGHGPEERRLHVQEIMGLFDAVIESSKVGVRKPEPRFYELACESLSVRPAECVFLDDLGINLKPAAAMGMTTIKVRSADQALDELEQVLQLPLR